MTERIERELWLPVAPEAVWETVTSDGWLADRVFLDLRPGGDAQFETSDRIRTGWVEDVAAPERLAFWWAVDDEPAESRRVADRGRGRKHAPAGGGDAPPLEVLDLGGVPLPGVGGARLGRPSWRRSS